MFRAPAFLLRNWRTAVAAFVATRTTSTFAGCHPACGIFVTRGLAAGRRFIYSLVFVSEYHLYLLQEIRKQQTYVSRVDPNARRHSRRWRDVIGSIVVVFSTSDSVCLFRCDGLGPGVFRIQIVLSPYNYNYNYITTNPFYYSRCSCFCQHYRDNSSQTRLARNALVLDGFLKWISRVGRLECSRFLLVV